MKKFLSVILLVMACTAAFAQAQITTKKEKLSDFTIRTMKVVLTGNTFYDTALRDAVRNTWTISPYEFCSNDEFTTLKKDKYLFFLLTVKQLETGISVLDLVRGGKEDIVDMLDVVSIPACASDGLSGREAAFMPALVDAIQSYMAKSLGSGFSGFGSVVGKVSKTKSKRLVFNEKDFSPQITDKVRSKFDGGITVTDDDTVDAVMLNGTPDTAVAYVVAPSDPQEGNVCYKMLFDARTHEIYYFKKHKISGSREAGFLKSDIRKITSGRK